VIFDDDTDELPDLMDLDDGADTESLEDDSLPASNVAEPDGQLQPDQTGLVDLDQAKNVTLDNVGDDANGISISKVLGEEESNSNDGSDEVKLEDSEQGSNNTNEKAVYADKQGSNDKSYKNKCESGESDIIETKLDHSTVNVKETCDLTIDSEADGSCEDVNSGGNTKTAVHNFEEKRTREIDNDSDYFKLCLNN
jgi:hypothetical protein